MNFDISTIQFEERVDNERFGETVLYFIAPKSMLEGKYPEAESMEISITFPQTHLEPEYASVIFSPTKDGSDYDWDYADLSYENIKALMKLAGLQRSEC